VAKDLRCEVSGKTIAARAWGPVEGRPVLAVHGWLDHADSFAELAPRLTGCRVVAVDKPGHGDSDWRSPDATYNLWEDAAPLFGVLDALGWERPVLLGHSRGAMTTTMMAALRPERVAALVCLDALLPSPISDADFVKQMRRHLADMPRRAAQPMRLYASKEACLRRRRDFGKLPQVAERLSRRAWAEEQDGYRVKADPRLQAASAVKMNRAQLEAVLDALDMPVLSLWATDGIGKSDWAQEIKALAQRHVPRITFGSWTGDHHGHLKPDLAETISRQIAAFLS